eukprot:460534_1
MYISNSNLYGAADNIFAFDGGDNYIINSHAQYGTIEVAYTVSSIQIIQSEFINVGKDYVLSPTLLEMFKMAANTPLSRQSPLVIGSSNVWIQSCLFSTNDSNGVITFSPAWPSTYDSPNLYSTVILINNTIEINHVIYNNTFSSYEPTKPTGIINVIGNVKMYIVYNKIIQMMQYKKSKSLFYLRSPEPICFSGNIFKATTIIDSEIGSIKSCFRNNIQEIFEKQNECYSASLRKTKYIYSYLNTTMFSFSESSPMDYWTAITANEPIIKINATDVILDNITFDAIDSFGNLSYAIMEMSNGEHVFLDVIINHMFMSFMYDPTNCHVVCYNILQKSFQVEPYISQLHIKCTNNQYFSNELQSLTFIESVLVNHTTAYYIYFEYNPEFVVDSQLSVSFYVTDQFNNVVEDYSVPITIKFYNAELRIDIFKFVNVSTIIKLYPVVTNDKAHEEFTIETIANNDDLVSADYIHITIIPRNYYKINWDLLWLISLLIIPCVIMVYFYIRRKIEYSKAFVVDKTLVLIIGISQFDDKELFLPGVKYAVDKLFNLWKNVHHYDVFMCNSSTLYCKKNDIIQFIDTHKSQLEDIRYNGVIVHIITHGEDDSFTTSDLKTLKTEFIEHEIENVTECAKNDKIVKVIFHHECRGTVDYSIGYSSGTHTRPPPKAKGKHKYQFPNSEENVSNQIEMQTMGTSNAEEKYAVNDSSVSAAYESNWITVYGTKQGRSMSDSGQFADCICDSFGKNATRKWKKNLRPLLVEIGQHLEVKTDNVELCTYKANLRYEKIRFEKCKS